MVPAEGGGYFRPGQAVLRQVLGYFYLSVEISSVATDQS